MATKSKNILQEAIADANALKEAAYANAQTVLMEHLKDNVKQFVEEELNENFQTERVDVETEDVSEGDAHMTEGDFEDDLDVDEEPSEDEEEEGGDFEPDMDSDDEMEEEGMYEGLTEDDLAEALQTALAEVSHGQLGDMELVMNTEPGQKSPEGIEDRDSKEEGWEQKTAPKAKGAQLYTGEQYHQEALKWKAKAAQSIKENIMLKKAMKKLTEALKETKLFNAKLFYASKLMQKEGLGSDAKVSIVKKMDSVKTMSEAKNLYEALETALGLMSEGAKPKKVRRSLTEALGSETTTAGSGAGVSRKSLNEDFVRRNQKLAGLINE